MEQPSTARPILVTGATGYIGGRLVPALLKAGFTVRAAARDPRKLEGRLWSGHPNLSIVAMDLIDPASVASALAGCEGAYYLVHSMNKETADFAETDRVAAHLFADAAGSAGLSRIVYLSGLGVDSHDLSHHLRSRHEVGTILKAGKTPVTILRAAMIIGSGSASFEIMRYLVERLPVMITPRWVQTPVQPVAVRNVIDYLVGVLAHPDCADQTFDIGGPAPVTYRQLFDIYADVAKLRRRWIVPVPVLTPRLSSYWINMVTPVPAHIARPLAQGLANPVVVTDSRIREIVPIRLIDYDEAIRLALATVGRGEVETSWRDAGAVPPPEAATDDDPAYAGGTIFRDSRSLVVEGDREALWSRLEEIGGEKGWPWGNRFWWWRGALDRLVGGYGVARGRRSTGPFRRGDALEMWRVADVDPGRRLELRSEMIMPGRAGLILEIEGEETLTLRLTAWLIPRGLAGIVYWYAMLPFHALIFPGTLRGWAKEAGARPL